MNRKVSVLVAAYNVAEYLEKCLESVINQTYQNIEIIVVNDGSTDTTGDICDHFKKADERVKVIHQKNSGLSAARNAGLKAATGDFVMFVDGDDFIKEGTVQDLLDKISSGDIAICGYQVFPNGKTVVPVKKELSGQDAAVELLTGQENYMVVSWNKLYRKKLFKGTSFPIGQKHEDSLTTYKILAKADTVVYVDQSLYYYTQHEGSIMSTVDLESRLAVKRLAAKEAKEYFKDDEKLRAAAEIAELLAEFSYIDSILAGKMSSGLKQHIAWVEENKQQLFGNQFLTPKLKTYIKLVTSCGGVGYRLFRKIKHD